MRKLSLGIRNALRATSLVAASAIALSACESPPGAISDEIEHFKYGSIGAEINGYPFRVWRELPTIFTAELTKGWPEFGFIQERDSHLPVGISVRNYGIDRVGFNCATCHTTRVNGQLETLLGAPADQLDLQKYLRFLIRSSKDSRFTADQIFQSAAVNQRPFSWLDRVAYRYYVIPKIVKELQAYDSGPGAWMKSRPDHGPGRTDAGNPWRVRFGMRPEKDSLTGAVDMPSLWQQGLRENTWMHWDGNNGSLAERNLSAALAGGATEDSLDHASIERVARWAYTAPAPAYPQPVSQQLAERGRSVFVQNRCAACHDVGAAQFGKTTPLASVGTDAQRVMLFSREMVAAFSAVGKGTAWQFKNYRASNGYSNSPLDGIWARAPYLHNGSIPTLHDLLLPPSQRPSKFNKGCADFDWVKVGRTCESGFHFDTKLSGNDNSGHLWGTEISTADRTALLEYLKTL